MEIKLQAFKALAIRHADQVKAIGGLSGYGLVVGADILHTENNKPRVFANLTTLANFARGLGVKSITVDLNQKPTAKTRAKKSATSPEPSTRSRRKPKAET